ncbi:MAG: CopD family protein [Nitrososphaerota archaeon]
MFSPIINAIILLIHLFAAVIFIGGSFFMWLVVVPASFEVAKEESQRTMLVGRIAKRFGLVSNISLIVLILTGIYNASWYLPSYSALLSTIPGRLLLAKVLSVALLLIGVYSHNVYFGRKIVSLAREGKVQQLNALRKKSRVVSTFNLVMMIVILLIAALMQVY